MWLTIFRNQLQSQPPPPPPMFNTFTESSKPERPTWSNLLLCPHSPLCLVPSQDSCWVQGSENVTCGKIKKTTCNSLSPVVNSISLLWFSPQRTRCHNSWQLDPIPTNLVQVISQHHVINASLASGAFPTAVRTDSGHNSAQRGFTYAQVKNYWPVL